MNSAIEPDANQGSDNAMLPIYQADAELTHAPDGDPSWQESALLSWYDSKEGVGGFLRLGHEVNIRQLKSCFGVFGPDGQRFRTNVTGAALSGPDRGRTIMGNGPSQLAKLAFANLNPRYDYTAIGQRTLQSAQPAHHVEAGTEVVGEVRIG